MANYKKIIFNIIKYLFFLSLGILLFHLVTKEYKLKELFQQLLGYNKWYIAIAIFISILSNVSRAIRWNMLLEPMGYKVKIFNAFLSVNIMYLANFFVPRGGEVARCGILAKTDNVPFAKLVGTVIIERTADAITLFILMIFVLFTQTATITEFFKRNPATTEKFAKLFTTNNIVILVIIIAMLIVALIIFRRKFKNTVVYKKITGFYHSLAEGVKTIFKLKRPLVFIFHTVFIYTMWFLMLYTFFKGFGPTSNFGIMVVITVFVLSSLAMIVPVPAGMGAFHFTVASALLIYGINFNTGVSFAFIMHTAINLYLDLFGLLALLYFLYSMFINSRNNARAK